LELLGFVSKTEMADKHCGVESQYFSFIMTVLLMKEAGENRRTGTSLANFIT
jgi:hypothetical protein